MLGGGTNGGKYFCLFAVRLLLARDRKAGQAGAILSETVCNVFLNRYLGGSRQPGGLAACNVLPVLFASGYCFSSVGCEHGPLLRSVSRCLHLLNTGLPGSVLPPFYFFSGLAP